MKSKDKRPIIPNINDSALARESWKIFQVISELVEGFERMVHIRPSVSIFGSARAKENSKEYKIAEEIAKRLSNEQYSVVTGGGPGIMEAGNKGAFSGKGFSIGLNIVLPHEEHSNRFQDISIRFRHFFTRKVLFVKYAAAYIVMPGGYGTLDELAEILALVQTKKSKYIPIILVNKKFWQGLVDWITNTLLPEKMISENDDKIFVLVDTADEAVNYITEFYKNNPLPNSEPDNIFSDTF